MQVLLARVRTWCGVRIDNNSPVTRVLLRDKVIARFPSEEFFEVVLCGSIKKQVSESPDDLPVGVWALNDNTRLVVDLTQPGGMEEAIRVLLNAYILSERPQSSDWWLSEERLNEDPTCEKLAEEIKAIRKNAATGQMTSD